MFTASALNCAYQQGLANSEVANFQLNCVPIPYTSRVDHGYNALGKLKSYSVCRWPLRTTLLRHLVSALCTTLDDVAYTEVAGNTVRQNLCAHHLKPTAKLHLFALCTTQMTSSTQRLPVILLPECSGARCVLYLCSIYRTCYFPIEFRGGQGGGFIIVQ